MTADIAPQHDVTDDVRAGLAAVSAVVLPGTDRLPSGLDVGAHLDLLDRVLAADPALTVAVVTVGRRAAHDGCPALADMPEWEPAHCESAVFALTAAYYLSREVLRALDYPGVGPRPIALATPDERVSDDLLAPVRDRGPIYVPAPD